MRYVSRLIKIDSEARPTPCKIAMMRVRAVGFHVKSHRGVTLDVEALTSLTRQVDFRCHACAFTSGSRSSRCRWVTYAGSNGASDGA